MGDRNSSKENILFIVEGKIGEVEHIKGFLNEFEITTKIKIYSFCTNIYPIFKYISENEIEKEETDTTLLITQIIRGIKSDKNNIKKLEEIDGIRKNKYSQIILIFDFDGHAEGNAAYKISEMMNFFDDSEENGKLYINYPMLESINHIENKGDIGFYSRKASKKKFKSYKNEVENFRNQSTIQNKNELREIIKKHIIKNNYLSDKKVKELTNDTKIENEMKKLEKSSEKYLFENIDTKKIFEVQKKLFEEKEEVHVLNTSFIPLIKLAEKKYFNYLNN